MKSLSWIAGYRPGCVKPYLCRCLCDTCILQDWRGGLPCFGWEMEDTRVLGMWRQGLAAPATQNRIQSLQLSISLLTESRCSRFDVSSKEMQGSRKWVTV